jgi:RPA family protein
MWPGSTLYGMNAPNGRAASLVAAVRLFAGEMVRTTVFDDETFLSPTGARGRRVFFTGALTAVRAAGGRVTARVADPTGTVTVAAPWRGEAAAALRSIEPPAFVAVSGALAVSHGEVALVPEAVARVEKSVRDLWVLRTADLTLRRIEALAAADGDPEEIAGMAQMVRAALSSVPDGPVGGAATVDARALLVSLLEECPGRRTAEEDLFARAGERGVGRAAAEAALDALLEEGECYTPSTGQVKLI